MKKANESLRKYAKENKVYLWEIADELGVCEQTIVRMLRKNVTEQDETTLRNIISSIAKRKNEKE